MKRLMLLILSAGASVTAAAENTVYSYENDGKTYVATVSAVDTISDEAIAVLDSNAVTNFIINAAGALTVDKGSVFTGDVKLGPSGSEQAARLKLKAANALGIGGVIDVKENMIEVGGAIVRKEVHFDCGSSWKQFAGIKGISNSGESVFKEKVTFSDRNFYIYPYEGSRVVFEGGLESAAGYPYIRGGTGGTLVFTNKPLKVSQRVSFYEMRQSGFSQHIVFAAPGNEMSGFGHENHRVRHAEILTTVDWAFDDSNVIFFFGHNSKWDLCGTQQRIGRLDVAALSSGQEMSVICNTAADRAKLYINPTANSEPQILFAGNLDVDFTGNYTTTVSHAMTATGEVTLNSGTLAFTSTGYWPASKLSVAAGAAVTIAGDETFSPETIIELNGSGSLSIAAGEGGSVVTQAVRHLIIDGVACEAGLYPMGEGFLDVLYTSTKEIADSTLEIAAGEAFTLDENVLCDFFDRISLGEGASLEISTDQWFADGAEFTVELGEGATLTLAQGIDLYAPSVVVGDSPVAGGRYTSENASWLQGAGAVYVPFAAIEGSEVEWTAAGADNSMRTAENWSKENVDLDNATTYARFSTGTSAVIGDEIFLNGMHFTSAGFNISAAEGGNALLRLASGGITSELKDPQDVPQLSVPIKIEGDQTWTTATNMIVSGALDSDPLARYDLNLNGRFEFGAGGSFSGDIYSSQRLDLKNGVYGIGTGKIVIGANKSLVIQDAVLKKDVFFDCFDSSGWNNNLAIWAGTSSIEGNVSFGNRNLNVSVYRNSYVTFKGGLNDADSAKPGFTYLGFGGGGTMTFVDHPVKIKILYFAHNDYVDEQGFKGHLILSAPGNSVDNFGWDAGAGKNYRFRGVKLKTTVDWAFDDAQMAMMIDGGALWDLCGTKQRVGHLNTVLNSGNMAVFTNSHENAATLYVKQKSDTTPIIGFGGNLNVDISGAFTTTIDHAITAKGDLAVNGGTLAFTADGSWKGAATVTTGDSGKISISSPRTFARTAQFVLESASSLEVAAGVEVWVDKLTIAGVEYSAGTFQFGEGKVNVGKPGTIIVVR